MHDFFSSTSEKFLEPKNAITFCYSLGLVHPARSGFTQLFFTTAIYSTLLLQQTTLLRYIMYEVFHY